MSAFTAPAARRSFVSRLPRLVVRTRTSENQMVMFTVISVGALAFMMLLPSPRAAFGAVETKAEFVQVNAEAKGPRLVVETAVDRACAGQAWGSEDLDCILAIAGDSGIKRTVRLADAGQRY
jgi:hypothetical protein